MDDMRMIMMRELSKSKATRHEQHTYGIIHTYNTLHTKKVSDGIRGPREFRLRRARDFLDPDPFVFHCVVGSHFILLVL